MGAPTRRQPTFVVTISAASGTGGSLVARRVAQQLGMPLLDRVTPQEIREAVEEAAQQTPCTVFDDDPRARQEVNTFLGTLGANTSYHLMSASRSREVYAALRRCLEAPLWELVNDGGGVVLGRSAEAAISTLVPALHVRLDGEPEARAQLNMALEGTDREEAWRHLREADRARDEATRRLYSVDPTDLRRYHLVLDVPRLGIDVAVETIVAASTTAALLQRERARAESVPLP